MKLQDNGKTPDCHVSRQPAGVYSLPDILLLEKNTSNGEHYIR